MDSSPIPSSQDPRAAVRKILEDESAVRFLRKANAKPFFTGLRFIDQDIPHGLRAGDVLEVFGGSGTGKSELMMGMLVFALLPQRYRELDFGGSEHGVVYFDNDLKFNVPRLVHLLTVRWERAIAQALLDSRFAAVAAQLRDDPTAKEKFLTSTLERLIIYRCTDSLQFAVTLATMESLLKSKETIRLLMIDTISAFYWQDKNDDGSIQKSSSRVPLILARLLAQHNLVVVAAKGRLGAPRGNAQEDEKDYLSLQWQKLVKYHLLLSRDPSSPAVTARFVRVTANMPAAQPTAPKIGHFKIDGEGITML